MYTPTQKELGPISVPVAPKTFEQEMFKNHNPPFDRRARVEVDSSKFQPLADQARVVFKDQQSPGDLYTLAAPAADPVNHPQHYTSHPSGIECIQVTEHMSFNLGNVVKYLWRADRKGAPLQDLKKASFYLLREIAKREKEASIS